MVLIARIRTPASQLIEARDSDGGLDDRELKATAGLVLAAGFETTVNLLANAIALRRPTRVLPGYETLPARLRYPS